MIRYRRRYWVIAASLSAVAGFVDAIGFIQLGGYFVSFMSGNSTRAGVGIADQTPPALIAASLVALFVSGVVLASLVGQQLGPRRPVIIILAVGGLLALAAGFDLSGHERIAIAAMTMAMGAANTVFERDGEVSIGVTYMTGSLVKAGQRIAAALRGGPVFAWVPYALLWCGLVTGACAGTVAYRAFELQGLWFAVAAVIAIALGALVAILTERHAV